MMEVDVSLPSPPPFSTKRPRSPECDRPAKRFSAAGPYSPILGHSNARCASVDGTVAAMQTNRRPLVDWVLKKDNLTIDATTMAGSMSYQGKVNATIVEDRIDKSMVGEKAASRDSPSQPSSPMLHPTPGPSEQHFQAQLFLPARHFERKHIEPTVQPGMSSSPRSGTPTHCHIQPNEHTISSRPCPSPTPSWSSNASTSTSRKQRFTMGPRADCEKCQLGVAGHWMHFD